MEDCHPPVECSSALKHVDAACDARPLTPPLPPPPLPPQIVKVLEIQHSTLERPDMTPREMAASVAAIMTAFPSEPPSAIADRLVNTLPGLVAAPQREMVLFSTTFAAELHRELCKYLL